MKKIVLTGPESTGKTTLCKVLSERFDALWIPEYAREYVAGLSQQYTYDDVEIIARKQFEQLTCVYPLQKIVLFDTDLIITKIWFNHCYKKYPKWLDDAIRNIKIDLYLLCRPDLPWQPDPTRENPNIRDFLYQCYKTEIKKTSSPMIEISGFGESRNIQAEAAVRRLLNE